VSQPLRRSVSRAGKGASVGGDDPHPLRRPAARPYIQSGNVLLSAPSDTGGDRLEADLGAVIDRHLGLSVAVVVRSHEQMRQVVSEAPAGFGEAPETFLSDTVFLKSPLASVDALRVMRLREGVDAAWSGDGVLYFRRLSARRSQSRMGAIVGSPEYRRMTIRNWATTTTLVALLDASADAPS
jgi:uncharacterized protein (DUF1697 family)